MSLCGNSLYMSVRSAHVPWISWECWIWYESIVVSINLVGVAAGDGGAGAGSQVWARASLLSCQHHHPIGSRARSQGTRAIAVRVGPKPAPSPQLGTLLSCSSLILVGSCASEQVGLGRPPSMGQGMHWGGCERSQPVSLRNFNLLSPSYPEVNKNVWVLHE